MLNFIISIILPMPFREISKRGKGEEFRDPGGKGKRERKEIQASLKRQNNNISITICQ